jgi:hypothetical protein
MRRRNTLVAFVCAMIVAIVGLSVAATTDHRNTAFSLDVADNVPVLTLNPNQALCQGVLLARAPFSSIEIWAEPAALLRVALRTEPRHVILIRRTVAVSQTPTGRSVLHVGGAGLRMRGRFTVCIRNVGRRAVVFEGGQPSRYSGRLSAGGKVRPLVVAMVFLRSHGPSLASLLPDIFARASLFKLSWVGAWTFWLLLAAVICAFGVAGAAVLSAVNDDDYPE